ncbi:hypothetical protein MRB53_019944 [Persea americana]|uniref:Uncharacterized protein n=1 Tax=Persea americana TaxID=3435 RepID=A0ACC2KZJ0_PERAE|nr:hypothetical protein MRB53_019944 [Persea americana]
MSIIPSFFGGRRSDLFYDPTSFDIWDPWHAADPWELISPSRDQTSPLANVRIDWKETQEAHIIQAELPGMKKEEVKVEVDEGRVLQIRGEKSQEREEKTDKWHKVERSWGKFLRRFRLPENAKVDDVKATMENGVLTVVVPKEEVKQPATKAIEISGGEKAEQQCRGSETAEQQSR